MLKEKIGVVGGSGLYDIEGVKDIKRVKVKTPFGDPSDEYTTGILSDREIVFLPRHSKGHKLLPSEVNYRANIYGMKKLGVERIISISAVGSLKKEMKPLDMVVPNQFVDRTNQARNMTFFGNGMAAHIALAEPVCRELSGILTKAGKAAGIMVHGKGTYINMEGPAFSTKAESHLYRSWGMDIIGMTNMAEAKLAREAEICYATLACVTDYDCWHMDEETETVSVDMVVHNFHKNIVNAKNVLKLAISAMPPHRGCACGESLKHAIMTPRDYITPEVKRRLKLIIGKYIECPDAPKEEPDESI